MEQNSLKKSLYVFLTSLLGILLFVTIQKSISLIGIILLNVDYSFYSFGTNPAQIHGLNIASFILALFLGGWYGVWIGLHWYKVVYEQGNGGWLHGFSGGLFHHHSSSVAHKPVTKVIRRTVAKPETAPQVHHRDMDGVGEPAGSWEFDDLLSRRQVKVVSRTEKEEVSVEKPKRKTSVVKKPRSRAKKTKLDT